MVRKLAAAMLGVGVLIPGLANALGLGEIKLNSALSEPLDAEIELVQVRELTSNEILPALASQEDFASANVERFHFLTDLKFEVTVNDQGKSIIKIRSRKPVKEPFLNFLVEVNWPAGRLLREYTLLLDPPIYSSQQADSVAAPTTSSATPTRSVQPVTTTYQTDSPQSSYSSGEYAQGSQAGTHTIGSNDSLWSIARSMKPSDRVSIQQTMMAIQRKNPDAFIDDNINLLKKGAVLRAPTEEEVMQLSSRDAIAMAAEQNRQWRERISGSSDTEARQIDLSGRSVSREQDPASGQSPDRLKLVSAGTDSSDTGQGGAGDSGQLRDQLVVAEETVDKFKLENEELRLRMSDLEDQLDTSEKVLTLKDEQIAALQAKLRELEAAQQAEMQATPAVEDDTSEPVMAGDLITEEPEQAPMAEDDVAAGELIAPEESSEEGVDYNFAEDTGESEDEMVGTEAMPSTATDAEDPAMDAEPDLAGVEVEEPKQPEPAQPPAVPQQDLVSQILSNPMYLAAGGGAIVLLIVLGLVAARRKQAGAELEEDIPEEFDLPEAQGGDDLLELDSVNLEEDDAFEEAVEASADEETVPQTSDVIGEADIYIAYGRFPQAIEMLEKAAESEPDRADIRLKLCEVCAEANEPEIFMNHYRVLQDVGTSADVSRADGLRDKLSSVPEDSASSDHGTDQDGDDTILADSAAESFDFDDLDSALSEPGETPASETGSGIESELEQESDTGLDFDLGDLEDTGSSFPADQAEAGTEEPSGQQSAAEVAGLDFDLNLDLDDEEDSPKTEDDASTLDFDLDTAFDSDSSSAAPAEPTNESDEVSLDFDTDFSLDEVSGAGSTETPDDSNKDLSMDFNVEEPEAPAEEVPESNDMDFDLDFDSSTTELDETPSLDFSDSEEAPAEPAPEAPASSESEDDLELDSQSAAQLADELDLDLDADFLDSGEPSDADVPADDDQTIIADMTPPAAPAAPAANDMDDSGEELDFLSDADEASTKLDLARAYIDMGDRDGAKDILDEVMIEGNDNQKSEAKDLLTRLES